MDFLLTRRAGYRPSDGSATLGDLTIVNDPFRCYTLEPKAPISAGKYEVILTPSARAKVGGLWSPRPDHALPLLVNVVGHEGVRIHAGNSAKDTSNCILVGLIRDAATIENSRSALIAVMAKLEAASAAAERCFLTIVDA